MCGIRLSYCGANRYVRSQPQSLEKRASDAPIPVMDLFIDKNIAMFERHGPGSAMGWEGLLYHNSFRFVRHRRLNRLRVSRADRWYEPREAFITMGDPYFTGVVFFRNRDNYSLPRSITATEFAVACGTSMDSSGAARPWLCLSIQPGCRFTGNSHLDHQDTRLYSAAVKEEWNTVRLLGKDRPEHAIRLSVLWERGQEYVESVLRISAHLRASKTSGGQTEFLVEFEVDHDTYEAQRKPVLNHRSAKLV